MPLLPLGIFPGGKPSGLIEARTVLEQVSDHMGDFSGGETFRPH